MSPKIRIVVATRASKEEFLFKTAPGKSLAVYNSPDIALFERNTLGLPTVYNQAIETTKSAPATQVFVHDKKNLSSKTETQLQRFVANMQQRIAAAKVERSPLVPA